MQKLNKAVSDMLDDPAIRKQLEDLGLEIVPPERRSPEYLAKYLPEEIERWAKVVQGGRHPGRMIDELPALIPATAMATSRTDR